MDRVEKVGLGVAAAGHIVLFALLSASLLAPKNDRPAPPPMDVSLVDQVALDAAAPAATEAPAASRAPEVGPIEEAPPPAPAEAAPEPAPPAPQPKAAPPPKPAPVAKPQPKAPAASATAKAKAPAKPAAASKPTAKPAATRGSGTQVAAKATRPRGGSLGDIMKGIVPESAPQARGQTPRAAAMSAQAAADIGSAITRQVQPCAQRQVLSGSGVNRIRVTLRLNINKDGSLAGRPQVVDSDGVDDENRRYLERVSDLSIAAFVACSPLKGLPPELYDVPRGWKVFRLRFKLPG